VLALNNADVYYGKAQILHGVSIAVDGGSLVSLIGRNGAGKTTTLKSIMGLVCLSSGQRLLNDVDITRAPPYVACRLGISYVPENRQVFGKLTVEENLQMAQIVGRSGYWTQRRAYELFPHLQARRRQLAETLSGGEQQMLAIARGVLTNPEVLLLDDPTEGLAPLIVESVIGAIRAIGKQGVNIVLVDQNLQLAMELADYVYVLDNGSVIWNGNIASLRESKQSVEQLISV
jgi:branched-chain amino acid transport system ATP-binding protein